MEKKYSRGFTLTELIIVISILSFLALMIMVYLRTQVFKGNDARRKTDIKKIQIAVEEYEKDHDCYPTPDLVVCSPGTGLSPYITKIPCDPVTNASYYYDYEDSSCPGWYRMYTKLDNVEDEDAEAGIGPFSAYNYYQGSPNSPTDGDSGSTPPPSGGGGGGGGTPSTFYGCQSGVCVPIGWDESRPGPACDPNYQSPNCYGQCGPVQVECTPWQ
jgi:prepilin-type N-terminal cleavage/methylation domain-containing protein